MHTFLAPPDPAPRRPTVFMPYTAWAAGGGGSFSNYRLLTITMSTHVT